MGYPMTWQRFINRNRLAEGDYDDVGQSGLVVTKATAVGPGELSPLSNFYNERIDHQMAALKLLLGDLRRLEADAVDEKSTCWEIARRTGIDNEIVAAVLKEFFAW